MQAGTFLEQPYCIGTVIDPTPGNSNEDGEQGEEEYCHGAVTAIAADKEPCNGADSVDDTQRREDRDQGECRRCAGLSAKKQHVDKEYRDRDGGNCSKDRNDRRIAGRVNGGGPVWNHALLE